MLDDSQLTASKAALEAGFKTGVSGAQWIKRFNDGGIEGLADNPRSGAPRTHSIEVRSKLIDLAMHRPSSLDYPFELWTLERLQISFKEREGIYLSDSTIWNWINEEGLNWKRQQSWFHNAEKQDDQFIEKKGAIILAYVAPPVDTRIICIDELGPIAVKTYPGEIWTPGTNRATFEPDYGRRGKLWVHGAFEPATGQAEIVISPRRDSATHIELIEKVIQKFPSERWLLIEDNLSIHHSRDVKTALLAWPEIQVQFIPKYACWLNLIEPWWKQLRSLALKGRRFETLDELTDALNNAVCWWNAHKQSLSMEENASGATEL